MKADPEVKMISAEAPILFAKGCDIFITELTRRAWIHAEENKRRTLQRSDIAAALAKSDMFDFLIDHVPREEGSGGHTKRAGGQQAGTAAATAVQTQQQPPQDAILGINRGLVSTQIMQALTPTAEGINSNGDDLPAVQFLHAKRPKKKRGLPGFVNGVRVAAMADTGASVNVISEAYAQKMRLEIVESDASYRLGNSRSARCIGKLCTAQAYRSYESR
jgi:Core histone H2A/H2B/H3/H4/gag-polyprotein putative aspartyl protease